MNSFSDVGSLNAQEFSSMSARMTQGQRVMAVVSAAMGHVPGPSAANSAPSYDPSGSVGHHLNLWA
ncbi:MAG: hypothetical protein AB7F75_00215 [Planctomycetota bacterium]